MMNKPLPPGVTADQLVALHATAADWFTRRQVAGWTGADERALTAWLEASPLHRETFESLGRTRMLFGMLAEHRAEAPVKGRAGGAKTPATRARTPGWWAGLARGPALASALAVLACVLLVGGWQVWEQTPSERLSLASDEQVAREFRLPDGSVVALNIDTRLEVRYYPRRREVVLQQGEAFFEVAANAGRPFTVDAGRSRVRVVGTAFNVHAAPSELVVKVQEGRVEVRPDRDAPQGPVLSLVANTGIAIDAVTGLARPVQAVAETIGGWRSGHLRFQRTPLGEVVQELARYLRQPVVLADPVLATLPVSGYFKTAKPADFLELLPDQLPVKVVHEANGAWVVTRR